MVILVTSKLVVGVLLMGVIQSSLLMYWMAKGLTTDSRSPSGSRITLISSSFQFRDKCVSAQRDSPESRLVARSLGPNVRSGR